MIYEMLSGINPFKVRNKNKYEKLQMILDDDIEMMPMFSDDAKSLISGLLSKKVKTFLSSLNVNSQKRGLDTMEVRRSSNIVSLLVSIGLHSLKRKLTHPFVQDSMGNMISVI
jgi:hypothetical protein